MSDTIARSVEKMIKQFQVRQVQLISICLQEAGGVSGDLHVSSRPSDLGLGDPCPTVHSLSCPASAAGLATTPGGLPFDVQNLEGTFIKVGSEGVD